MRKRAGIILICRPTNEVAVIYRKNNGREYYVFPGGGLEEDETFEQAALREANEELGIVLPDLLYLETVETEQAVEKYFVCIIEEKVNLYLQGTEKDRMSSSNIYIPQWVTLNKLSSLLVFPEEIKQRIVASMGELNG